MIIYEKIKEIKLQYNINGKEAKISPLTSCKIVIHKINMSLYIYIYVYIYIYI